MTAVISLRGALRGVLGVGAFLLAASASAQYVMDGSINAQDEPGVRYFGSAKDDSGELLPDVTFMLDTQRASFVFVTDEDGRFRGVLPLNVRIADVTPKCWKAGMAMVHISKRPGLASAPRPAVQVDCVLRKETSQ